MASAPAGGGTGTGGGAAPRGPAAAGQPGQSQPATPKVGQPGQPQARQVPLKARPIPPQKSTSIKGVRAEAQLDAETAAKQGLETESLVERLSKPKTQQTPPTPPQARRPPAQADGQQGQGQTQQGQPDGADQGAVDALADGQDQGAEISLDTYERLLGRKFKNVAEAEHHVRSLRSQAGRTEAASKREASWKETSDGYEKLYRETAARLQHLESRSQQAPQPGQDPSQQQGQDPGAEAVQAFVDSVTPEGWQHVKRLFEKEGPEIALAWGFHHFEKSMMKRLENLQKQVMSQLQPQLEPMLQEHQSRQQVAKAGDIWKEFAGYQHEGSNDPMFPELVEAMKSDPQAYTQVALAWLELGRQFGRDVAFSEWGVHAAYRDWKDWKAGQQSRGQAATRTASQVVRRMETDAARAAAGASPASSAPPAPALDGNPHDEAANLKKAIRNASLGAQKTASGFNLGFRE